MSVSKESKAFDYAKSPDGEDVFPKLAAIFKPVALTAFGVSTLDVMLYSHPKGYMQTLGRYIHFSWPIFGAATAFVLGSNIAGSVRAKDDRLNWFIGGMMAGSVYGVWRRTTVGGLAVGVALGMLAVGKKYANLNGTHLLYPDKFNVQYGGFRSGQQDWTLMKHRPGNWTTGEEGK
ncbi:hypothetical protein Zmor_021545 [Zophobas morio]|uniref:NADH dehydrogenase [ubiquinone] 1 alpha subcomplex subunit 11 n=1 Tax=Zophobas morio TaxID=2755281 RepID=A0AA38I684_9CUCU|nr:hypothetical protein Zmor_021545 [Zophobas morio]